MRLSARNAIEMLMLPLNLVDSLAAAFLGTRQAFIPEERRGKIHENQYLTL